MCNTRHSDPNMNILMNIFRNVNMYADCKVIPKESKLKKQANNERYMCYLCWLGAHVYPSTQCVQTNSKYIFIIWMLNMKKNNNHKRSRHTKRNPAMHAMNEKMRSAKWKQRKKQQFSCVFFKYSKLEFCGFAPFARTTCTAHTHIYYFAVHVWIWISRLDDCDTENCVCVAKSTWTRKSTKKRPKRTWICRWQMQ